MRVNWCNWSKPVYSAKRFYQWPLLGQNFRSVKAEFLKFNTLLILVESTVELPQSNRLAQVIYLDI